jgi:hypothetical protein
MGKEFVQCGFCNVDSRKLNLSTMLLLDNQSTVDLFCNRNLMTNVHSVDKSTTIRGKGRAMTTCKKVNVKGYGEVGFDERAITTILS